MAPIVLLTDFGGQDHYVGVLKGVILSLHPQAQIVDLSHEIPAYQVTAVPFLLEQSLPYFPQGTIFLVIVDPGVGGTRRPIALQTSQGYAVGPDNGVFTPLLPHVTEAVVLDHRTYWRTRQPSQTFHGRDIFAPVAAHLSLGVPLSHLGGTIRPETLVRSAPSPCLPTPQGWQGIIQYCDHFGNLITTIPGDAIRARAIQQVQWGDAVIPWGQCYGDVPAGHLLALVGSHGYVEIACHQGSAARILGAKIGDQVNVICQAS